MCLHFMCVRESECPHQGVCSVWGRRTEVREDGIMSEEHPQCIWCTERCRVTITLQSEKNVVSKRVNILPWHGCKLNMCGTERWLHTHCQSAAFGRKVWENWTNNYLHMPSLFTIKHWVNKSPWLWSAWDFISWNSIVHKSDLHLSLQRFE